jgi:tetratricopeptide (TPR) repeat protein
MLLSAGRDVTAIETQLFRPGPAYLLSAFCQPHAERERLLSHAASWLDLEGALRAAGAAESSSRITDRWLALLAACVPRLKEEQTRRELNALVEALDGQARAADSEATTRSLADLWGAMSAALRADLGLPPVDDDAEGDRTGTRAPTLRGRRWGVLRGQLASAIAELPDRRPTTLFPRHPRTPGTFLHEDYDAIRAALSRKSRGCGLAVITGRAGEGKREMTLAYAMNEHKAGRYSHVFVLRAIDAIRLEHDFLRMARALVPDVDSPAHLRRAALDFLERNDRWLIICHCVEDPAILKEFLPWNSDGHVLCTAGPVSDQPNQQSDPWAKYFDIELAGPDVRPLLRPMTTGEAARFLVGRPDHPPAHLDAVAAAVAPSRLAASLARRWLAETAVVAPDLETRLAEYRRRWEAARAGLADDDDEQSEPHPADLAGLCAAVVNLQELDARTRWRPEATVAEPSLEEAAVELLLRLKAFSIGPFPANVLDDQRYQQGDPPINDQRLVLLERWGLVDRAPLLDDEPFFEINELIRPAVERVLRPTPLKLDQARAAASLTMLRLMRAATGKPEGPPVELAFALLPHATSVAREEALYDNDTGPQTWQRPLVAVELYARTALCHFQLGGLRRGRRLFARVERILRDLKTTGDLPLLRDRETWPEGYVRGEYLVGGTEEKFEAGDPIARMSALVRSLRRAGWPTEARRLYELVEELQAAQIQQDLPADMLPADQVAHFLFEGAMAVHDGSESPEELRIAADATKAARKRWEALGDEPWTASADNLLAELAFDGGEYAAARAFAHRAETIRERVLERASTPFDMARAHAELARGWFLRGRIAYCDGQLGAASEDFERSVTAWSTAQEQAAALSEDERQRLRLPAVNVISAESDHILLHALLGEIDADAARGTWQRARSLFSSEHWSTARILSNSAQTLRLAGAVVEAQQQHVTALGICERTLGPEHRTTRIVRRKCAESLLDAGRASAAYHQLSLLLPAGRLDQGHLLASARVWAVLGRLLVESSRSTPLVRASNDDEMLERAREVLTYSRELFERAALINDRRNPGLVWCLANLSEVALRQGRREAVGLAEEAVELAGEQVDHQALPMVGVRARLIRARAYAGAFFGDPVDVGLLEHELASLPLEVAAHGDRFEVASARMAVEWLDVRHSAGDARTDRYRAWRDLVVDTLAPLRMLIGDDEPHQLLARGYAELGGFAEHVMPQDRRRRSRARNEREAERAMPLLDVDLHEVTRALEAHRITTRAAADRADQVFTDDLRTETMTAIA